MKKCTVCGEHKELSEFTPRPQLRTGAVYARCKACKLIYEAKYRAANKAKIAAYHAQLYVANRDAMARRNSEWQKANLESSRKRTKRHREKDIEASRAVGRAATKKWRQNNLGKWNAMMKKRKMQQLRAMPTWANSFFIAEAYDLAQRRAKATGFKWHVDHVVPLRGKGVCGLHIEHNIQVIPAIANLLKGSAF